MTRYHISPETGLPKLCQAKTSCPIGGEHFASKNEARRASENALTKQHGAVPAATRSADPEALAREWSAIPSFEYQLNRKNLDQARSPYLDMRGKPLTVEQITEGKDKERALKDQFMASAGKRIHRELAPALNDRAASYVYDFALTTVENEMGDFDSLEASDSDYWWRVKNAYRSLLELARVVNENA